MTDEIPILQKRLPPSEPEYAYGPRVPTPRWKIVTAWSLLGATGVTFTVAFLHFCATHPGGWWVLGTVLGAAALFWAFGTVLDYVPPTDPEEPRP